jgi:GNAT superfamily N-acetyltransferase
MVIEPLEARSLTDRTQAAVFHDDAAPIERFSSAVWKIDWEEQLPLPLGTGIVAQSGCLSRIAAFIARHASEIFEEDPATSRFLPQRMTQAKRRYYERFADIFEFVDGERTAGVLVGTPVDWSTYYVRFVATLPEYRGRKIFQAFLPRLLRILGTAGVERVEAETSPSNLAFVHIMNKFAFNVTGTVLSERWGALVRFTKFLDSESEEIFLRQYCSGVEYQRRRGGIGEPNPVERRTP